MLEKCVEIGLMLLCVIIGFLMGFKAARPEDKLINYHPDQGSTEEPEGDIWQDAMRKPDEDERVDTL